MNKTITPFVVGLSVAACLVLSVNQLQSNSSGGPVAGGAGYSGGIAENGRTCGSGGGCHNSAPSDRNGIISIDLPNGYIAGETYSLEVMAEEAGISKWGFQISAQNSSGEFQGSWNLVDNGTRNAGGSPNYVGHNGSGTSGSNSKTWQLEWVAPAEGSGDVTFFAVVNATNGNGSTSGDKILKDAVTVSENISSSTKAILETSTIVIQNGQLQVSNYHITEGILNVYSINGEVLESVNFNGYQQLSIEYKGILIIELSQADQRIVRKIASL